MLFCGCGAAFASVLHTASSRSAKSCALRGDNRGRPANAGRSAVRLSRGSSPFAETREPVCGNSPPAVAARVPGSRPPIAADVGGLEPSAPRVASDGQTLSHGQSSHLFVPSALWES